MECSLGVVNAISLLIGLTCLNPYSNGMLTWLVLETYYMVVLVRLNPYSNGMLTWTNSRV